MAKQDEPCEPYTDKFDVKKRPEKKQIVTIDWILLYIEVPILIKYNHKN